MGLCLKKIGIIKQGLWWYSKLLGFDIILKGYMDECLNLLTIRIWNSLLSRIFYHFKLLKNMVFLWYW